MPGRRPKEHSAYICTARGCSYIGIPDRLWSPRGECPRCWRRRVRVRKYRAEVKEREQRRRELLYGEMDNG